MLLIATIMFTIASYQEYAKNFDIQLKSYEGVLIYVENDQEIPEQALFIPASINREKNMAEAIKEILTHERKTAYTVYFQAIRWIMPDIGKTIRKLKSIDVNYNHHTDMKLVFGKFTFTDKPIDVEFDVDETVYHDIALMVAGQTYYIKVQDLPLSYGYVKFFEEL